MLQLIDVCKSYTVADFTQTALDHVSVAFRDNEFVAVLGPSGSGKTTMLNIIGALTITTAVTCLSTACPRASTRTVTGIRTATTASASCSRHITLFRTKLFWRTLSWR